MKEISKLWRLNLIETASIIDPNYTLEDYITDMLSDEIRKEIDKAILANLTIKIQS